MYHNRTPSRSTLTLMDAHKVPEEDIIQSQLIYDLLLRDAENEWQAQQRVLDFKVLDFKIKKKQNNVTDSNPVHLK